MQGGGRKRLCAVSDQIVSTYPATHFCDRLAKGPWGVDQESTVGTLCFVCPTSGREVDTGIDVDPLSSSSLRGEQLGCPECLEVHQLSNIEAWVSDNAAPEPTG